MRPRTRPPASLPAVCFSLATNLRDGIYKSGRAAIGAFAQYLVQRERWCRPREQEALALVAAQLSQVRLLRRGLDTFACHAQVQRLGQIDHAAHDSRVVGILAVVVDRLRRKLNTS